MTKREIEARETIIQATVGLIRECGDISRITMREIAARANVGTGLINYHFQTKENLINICVQRIIGRIIGEFDPLYKSLQMGPIEKLKYLVRQNADFLVNNPGLSRISILSDMYNGSATDNTEQTTEAYLPVMREVMGEAVSEMDLFIRFHMIISAMQSAFLRSHVLKEKLGIDLKDKAQRDVFADRVVDMALQ